MLQKAAGPVRFRHMPRRFSRRGPKKEAATLGLVCSCSVEEAARRRPPMMPEADCSAKPVDPEVRAAIGNLSAAEAEGLRCDWDWWARDNQRAPAGAWANWLILAGRGFGKT